MVRTGRTTTFQHTEKTLEKIKEYKKKHGVNKSLAINEMLEAYTIESRKSEQKQDSKGDFWRCPPFLYCGQAKGYVSKDTLLDPDEETGCAKCRYKRKCGSWRLSELF